MISPSDGVPERGLDWFLVATEPCGGGTSDLGEPQRVSEYLGIYSAKKGYGRPPRWAQPTRARLGPQARPCGLCPLGAPLWYFFGPLVVFWSKRILQKKSLHFGLRLILISCEVKNKQKIATGTGHYVNRLVP